MGDNADGPAPVALAPPSCTDDLSPPLLVDTASSYPGGLNDKGVIPPPRNPRAATSYDGTCDKKSTGSSAPVEPGVADPGVGGCDPPPPRLGDKSGAGTVCDPYTWRNPFCGLCVACPGLAAVAGDAETGDAPAELLMSGWVCVRLDDGGVSICSGGRGTWPEGPARAACAASALDSAEGDGAPEGSSLGVDEPPRPRSDPCPALPLPPAPAPPWWLKWSASRRLFDELLRENAVSGRSGLGKCRLKKLELCERDKDGRSSAAAVAPPGVMGDMGMADEPASDRAPRSGLDAREPAREDGRDDGRLPGREDGVECAGDPPSPPLTLSEPSSSESIQLRWSSGCSARSGGGEAVAGVAAPELRRDALWLWLSDERAEKPPRPPKLVPWWLLRRSGDAGRDGGRDAGGETPGVPVGVLRELHGVGAKPDDAEK